MKRAVDRQTCGDKKADLSSGLGARFLIFSGLSNPQVFPKLWVGTHGNILPRKSLTKTCCFAGVNMRKTAVCLSLPRTRNFNFAALSVGPRIQGRGKRDKEGTYRARDRRTAGGTRQQKAFRSETMRGKGPSIHDIRNFSYFLTPSPLACIWN